MSFTNLSNDKLLALVIYGEARGEPTEGKQAVGEVILNRVRKGGWFGDTIAKVVLKPYQFSCFLPSDPNYRILTGIAADWDNRYTHDIVLQACLKVATGLLAGSHTLLLPEGTCYYKVIGCPASWAAGMVKVATIGHQEFFKERA